jgi:hypothetical protein
MLAHSDVSRTIRAVAGQPQQSQTPTTAKNRQFTVAILIIGSLIWDEREHRRNWRSKRLHAENRELALEEADERKAQYLREGGVLIA